MADSHHSPLCIPILETLLGLTYGGLGGTRSGQVE
eukprot:COSAG02_NODE_53811_length_299_cov_1.095000_1_plen_34_part_10